MCGYYSIGQKGPSAHALRAVRGTDLLNVSLEDSCPKVGHSIACIVTSLGPGRCAGGTCVCVCVSLSVSEINTLSTERQTLLGEQKPWL